MVLEFSTSLTVLNHVLVPKFFQSVPVPRFSNWRFRFLNLWVAIPVPSKMYIFHKIRIFHTKVFPLMRKGLHFTVEHLFATIYMQLNILSEFLKKCQMIIPCYQVDKISHKYNMWAILHHLLHHELCWDLREMHSNIIINYQSWCIYQHFQISMTKNIESFWRKCLGSQIFFLQMRERSKNIDVAR